jgi:hypothetical protein
LNRNRLLCYQSPTVCLSCADRKSQRLKEVPKWQL